MKLAAAPSFRMPSLDGLASGMQLVPIPLRHLTTTYFDTDDLRLARWGVNLRYGVGEGWAVTLSAESKGAGLVSPELVFGGSGRRPPAPAADLVRAFVRSTELRPQARLKTVRRGVELHDADGSLAAVFEDEVSVFEGRRLAARFRELEIEAREDTPPAVLERLVERLQQAGAGAPDTTPKHLRALGTRATQPREVLLSTLPAGATAGEVVRNAIAGSVIRLIEHDPVMRLDADPEGVHQARVATRRLRSDLRTFRSLVDPEWATSLRDELGWLAGILGAVRDGDVMLERIRAQAAGLPDASSRGVTRVIGTLEADRGAARAELLKTLRTDRYLALLDRLVVAANAPALLLEADLPATTSLPGLVRGPWRSLAKHAKTLGGEPSNEGLHALRIRTKRVRYAAEAVAPLVGRRARVFATTAAALQDVLGTLNDAVTAERWLRDWARESRSPQAAFAAGELAGLERARADRERKRWKKAWKDLAAPSLRSWM